MEVENSHSSSLQWKPHQNETSQTGSILCPEVRVTVSPQQLVQGRSIHHAIAVEQHYINLEDRGQLDSSVSNGDIVERLLFFGAGLGSSIGYISTLASLVYYMVLYGPDSFIVLNLAVYLPLLPVSVAQAHFDESLDRRFLSQRAFMWRGCIGYGLILIGTVAMAVTAQYHHPGEGRDCIVLFTLLQGTGGAMLYGSLNQVASFCGGSSSSSSCPLSGSSTTTCSRSGIKAAVAAGVQGSALVVLVVSIVTGFGTGQEEYYRLFVWVISSIEALCWGLFLWLVLGRPVVVESMWRRDFLLRHADQQKEEQQQPMQSQLEQQNTMVMQTESLVPATSLSFDELWKATGVFCWILLVTLIPSFLVGSWFTRVATEWIMLAQVLFYVRIGADFLGRLATIWVTPQSSDALIRLSIVRIGLVLFFFASAQQLWIQDDFHPRGSLQDWVSIALVAAISFLSGYLVTGCYQLAPSMLVEEIREPNLSKQASLLNVAFAVAAIGGVVASLVFAFLL